MKILFILIMVLVALVVVADPDKNDFWKVLFKNYNLNESETKEDIRSHCGRNVYNNRFLNKRILGGQESKEAEWPWLVSLLLWTGEKNPKEKNKIEHFCAGTLISSSWILTAAHCFEKKWLNLLSSDPAKWTARLGEYNLYKDESHQVDHKIKSIFIHQQRYSDNMENDVALIKLSRPAKFTKHIKPACLPYPKEKFYEKTKCSAIGWGHTSYNGSMATVPRHVALELVSFKECKDQYEIIRSIINSGIYRIKPTMICAGNEEGKDACQYDSGGPLLCKSTIDDTWITSGIVSFGFGCGMTFPGVYTRVTSYLNWIQNIISKN